jgi:hypothetical protein
MTRPLAYVVNREVSAWRLRTHRQSVSHPRGAPQGGQDPSLLREEHAQRFVADQRHRARHGLRSLGIHRADGKPSTITETTRRMVFNHLRTVAYRALETGASDSIGLHRDFITAFPGGGPDPSGPAARSPTPSPARCPTRTT